MNKKTVLSTLPALTVAVGGVLTIGPISVLGQDSSDIACAIGVFVAGTFAAAAGNAVNIVAHGYTTGAIGQLTTTGSLPTGLSTSQNYWIIVVDANHVMFASSLANALAGTAITITGGTTLNTFTPNTLTGGTVIAQWSNDGTTWFNIGSATNVTAALNFGVLLAEPPYRYVQLLFTITAGALSTSTTAMNNIEL